MRTVVDATLADAWELGFRARQDGLRMRDNPYVAPLHVGADVLHITPESLGDAVIYVLAVEARERPSLVLAELREISRRTAECRITRARRDGWLTQIPKASLSRSNLTAQAHLALGRRGVRLNTEAASA